MKYNREQIRHNELKKFHQMFVKFLCLALFLGLYVPEGYAQNMNISGIVRTPDEVPMPGVSVKVAGTNNATVTDINGNFKLNKVMPGSVLTVSFLGMEDKLVTVNKETNRYIITLEEKATVLNEVVAIGYGKTKRGDLSGSVAVVKGEELTKSPVHSFDQALGGKIAGVQISSNEGQPGNQSNIIVRGVGSLTQDNSPLYVVDGFPLEDNLNDAINPEDIESISVLKDASATAIYGARGSNGVIIIETKKGKPGKSEINFSASYGFQEVTKTMKMMNAYEFVKYQLEVNEMLATADYIKPEEGIDLESYKSREIIDWQDRTFRRVPIQVYDLSVRGGTKNSHYSISGSYFNQKGIIVNSGYKRYQGRANFEQDVTSKLRVGANVNYSSASSYGQEASSYGTTGHSSTYLLYNIWGYRPIPSLSMSEETLIGETFDPGIDYSGQTYVINPVLSAENEYRYKIYKTLLLNVFSSYKFNRFLTLRVTGNYGTNTLTNKIFNNSSSRLGNPVFPSNIRGINGSYRNSLTENLSNANTLAYGRTFNRIHRLNATLGTTFSKRRVEIYGFESQQIPNENLGMSGIDEGTPYLSKAIETSNSLMSYFARLNYILRGKYIFTSTFRADWSSKFAKGKRWGYFPSAAFAWRFSEEKFMKNIRQLTNAKVRMSYGETGNNRVTDFPYLAQMVVTASTPYSFQNNTPTKGIVAGSPANRDLTWETAAQFDLGLDLGFFNNRIEFTADFYNKITRDLQLLANIPYYTGYPRAFRNIGKLRNRGIEFSLSTVNFDNKDFTWTTSFNISFNKNKVLALADDESWLKTSVGWGVNFNSTPLYYAEVGKPAAQFYGYIWDGNYQYSDFNQDENGNYILKDEVTTNGMSREKIQPGDIKYRDLDGDKVVDQNDLTILGNAYPVHIGGFTNDFRYRNFSLNVFFQWSYGNKIMNANRILFEGNTLRQINFNQFASYVNRWTPENQNNELYRTLGEGPIGVYSNRTLEDGSFLRLKTITLSYDVPQQILKNIKVRKMTWSLSAQNLLTFTKYSGMDPEVSVRNSALTPGFDYSAYPRAKNLVLSFKLLF